MKVRILKDGTRCAGEVYDTGAEIECSDKQGDKLIVLGRASRINTRGARKAADPVESTDDTDRPNDDGE